VQEMLQLISCVDSALSNHSTESNTGEISPASKSKQILCTPLRLPQPSIEGNLLFLSHYRLIFLMSVFGAADIIKSVSRPYDAALEHETTEKLLSFKRLITRKQPPAKVTPTRATATLHPNGDLFPASTNSTKLQKTFREAMQNSVSKFQDMIETAPIKVFGGNSSEIKELGSHARDESSNAKNVVPGLSIEIIMIMESNYFDILPDVLISATLFWCENSVEQVTIFVAFSLKKFHLI
jgi:hypothetical protein